MRALAPLFAVLLALAAVPAPGAELPPIGLRSGNHAGFGRLVLDLPAGTSATLAAAGEGRVIVEAEGAAFGPAPRPPRNLRGIESADGRMTLLLAPGAGWRSLRLPGRLVIDLLDPSTPAAPHARPKPPAPRVLWSGPPSRQHPTPAPSATPAVTQVAAPAAGPAPALAPPSAPPRPAQAAVPPAPVAPEAQGPLPPAGPVAIAARLAGRTVTLPFAASTGAAAFRRGSEAVVVFDEPRPLDLAALHGTPAFGDARVQLLPAATVLRLPLAADVTLRLARDAAGWTLTEWPQGTAPPLAAILAEAAAGRLLLTAASPAQIVSVPDPQTGTLLLVGTERRPGEAVPVAQHSPDYALLATWQGVVVEPVSDNDVLRVAAPGFVLEGGGARPLALATSDGATRAAAAAAQLTRRWDLPPLPVPALWRRLQTALDDDADAPPQARAARRLTAVQAQIALGLDAEAQALARLAATDDARAAEAPDAPGLAAVAALLAGRPDQSAAIEDARLSGTDEVTLWRAVRAAEMREGAPAAASEFAATLPLLLAYPEPLRSRLLPLAAETMVLGGAHDAANRLLAVRKDDASLDYARALLDAADGRTAPALATLDRLARSPDRLLRARAAVRAVELRLPPGVRCVAWAAGAL